MAAWPLDDPERVFPLEELCCDYARLRRRFVREWGPPRGSLLGAVMGSDLIAVCDPATGRWFLVVLAARLKVLARGDGASVPPLASGPVLHA